MSLLALAALVLVAVIAAGAGLLMLALWVYTRRRDRQRHFAAIRASVHQVRLQQYEQAERDGTEPPTEYLRAPYWARWR